MRAVVTEIAICFLPLSACLYAASTEHTNRALSQSTQIFPFPLCTLEHKFPYPNFASPCLWILSISPTKRGDEVEVLLGSVSRILSFCYHQYDLLSSSRLRFLATSVISPPYTSSVAACAGLAVSFLRLLVSLFNYLCSSFNHLCSSSNHLCPSFNHLCSSSNHLCPSFNYL